MLPLDVYLQNEDHLVMSTTTGEISDELKGTRSEKLLRADPEARVVVNFHGVSHLVLFMNSCPTLPVPHTTTSYMLGTGGYISSVQFSLVSYLSDSYQTLVVASNF